MKNNSVLLADECFRVSQVGSSASAVTLRAEHLLTGLTRERSVAFAEEPLQRRLLLAELASAVELRYPAQDFVVEHLRLGPEHGAALLVRHLPTGLSVQRTVGYDPQPPHLRELFAELIQKLQP